MTISTTNRAKIKEDLANIIVFSKPDGILESPDKDSIEWYIDNITFIDSLIEKIRHGEEAVFYQSAINEYDELHLKIKENKVYVTDIWGNTLVRGMIIKDVDVSDIKYDLFKEETGTFISISFYHNEEIVEAMPPETIEEYQNRWTLIMDVILSVCFHRIRQKFLYPYDKEEINEIENIKNFKMPSLTKNKSQIKVFIEENGKKMERKKK